MQLIRMDDFFASVAEDYDAHMLEAVPGCKAGYIAMAESLPPDTGRLLDLGCGTGLELDAIFARMPALEVVGIDLTEAMLDRLRGKHAGRKLTLICGDFFTVDFGREAFHAAVSFQSLHHFTHQQKRGLYRRLYDCLRGSGVYLECDYMVTDQTTEDFYFAEAVRLRKEQKIPEGPYYHYDTPCTIENQKRLLLEAGFSAVEQIFREENTTMLIAKK